METDQRGNESISTLMAKIKSESETKALKQQSSKNSYSTKHQRGDTNSVSTGLTTQINCPSITRKRGIGSDKFGTTEAESTKGMSTISSTNVDNDENCILYPDSDLEFDKNTSSANVKHGNPHTKEHTSRTEQIYATLYGQCIGDAIGLLTEFMSKSEAEYRYGHKVELEYEDKFEDSHRKRWEVGDWTDDSDQMIVIMQSLTDKDGVVTPNDFARRLVRWREYGFKELDDICGMGIGHTTYNIISRKDFEQYPHKKSKEVWEESGGYLAPNGGIMRTSILGIHDWWNLSKVYANAIDICKTTHYDARCQASAVAVCTAISLMLQRGSRHFKPNGEYVVETIIEDAFGEALTCLQSKDERESLWKCLQCEQLSELKLDENNAIGYTYKCLGAGFWALKQNNFRKALQEVVMSGGDADTNAAVAGALLGCKLGNRKLFPATWLKLKHKSWLDKQIQRYLKVLKKRHEDWNRVFGKE